MSTQPRLVRLAVMVLLLLVVAGCFRVGAVSHDAQPPLVDPAVAVSHDGGPASTTSDDVVAPAMAALAAPQAPASGAEPAHDAVPPADAAADAAADAEPDPAHPATERPAWLGTVPLPNAPDDGSFLPTPPELVDRRLPPPPTDLPQPESDDFAFQISEVPPDVLARSTWTPECPVALQDLRYLTVTHWGFDDRVHTGEVIVHAAAAEQIAGVFAWLHRVRYPIEELRVISPADMTAISSGDGNVSSAFVCRRSTSSSKWSEHSYGTAIDLNPFHNPYVKGSMIVPGLAGAYADRNNQRPGMIQQADEVIAAFDAIGWTWGGTWSSSKDWMHFSANGR